MTHKLEKALEEAAEGSRELDARIAVATFREPHGPDDLIYATVPVRDDHCVVGTYWRHSRSGMSLHTSAPVSTSLDAALALVSRVCPTLELELIRYPDGVWRLGRATDARVFDEKLLALKICHRAIRSLQKEQQG